MLDAVRDARLSPIIVEADDRLDLVAKLQIADLPRALLIDRELGVVASCHYATLRDPKTAAAWIANAATHRAAAAKRAGSLAAATDGPGRVTFANDLFARGRLREADAIYFKALPLLSDERVRDDVEVFRIFLEVLGRDHDAGIRLATAFLRTRPNSPDAPRAAYYLAFLHFDRADLAETRAAVKRVIEQFPTSTWAAAAAELGMTVGG